MKIRNTVKWITRAFFVGALTASTVHCVQAGQQAGLAGWEVATLPLMIDGVAVLGWIMRSEEFASSTRKLGLKVQMIMATVSMIVNVYAASNWGQVVYGMAVVGLYVAAEGLGMALKGADTERAEIARQKRSQAAKRAAATRKANAPAKLKIAK